MGAVYNYMMRRTLAEQYARARAQLRQVAALEPNQVGDTLRRELARLRVERRKFVPLSTPDQARVVAANLAAAGNIAGANYTLRRAGIQTDQAHGVSYGQQALDL